MRVCFVVMCLILGYILIYMATSNKTDFYQIDDETNQSILRAQQKSFGSTTFTQKTFVQRIVQKSDKIIAIVLIGLLLFFFMQSSGDSSPTPALIMPQNAEQTIKNQSLSPVKVEHKKNSKQIKLKSLLDDDDEQQEKPDIQKEVNKKPKIKKTNKKIVHDQQISQEVISKKKDNKKDNEGPILDNEVDNELDTEDNQKNKNKQKNKKKQENYEDKKKSVIEDSLQKQELPQLKQNRKKLTEVEVDSDEELIKKIAKKKGKTEKQQLKNVEKSENNEDEEKNVKIKEKVKDKKKVQKQNQQQKTDYVEEVQSQKPIQKTSKKSKNQQQQAQSSSKSIIEQKGYQQPDASELKFKQHYLRTAYLKSKQKTPQLQFLKLAKYNLKYPDINQKQMQTLFKEEQDRMENKYHLSQYPQQLSMCAIIYQGDNKKPYSHEYALNSVINQKYQNFIVVYIADGMSEQSSQIIQNYITEIDTNSQVSFVWTPEKKFYLESVINAIKNQCSQKKVTVLIDGDDQLLGRLTFKVLNAVYRNSSANLVYGNFIQYHYKEQQMKLGFSTQYDLQQKLENKYRAVGQKFGSLKTFRTKLAKFIHDSDLKDPSGNFYRYAGDYALIYPLLQLACGQVHYMPEYNYLYFGYEVDPTYGNIQISTGRQIRDREHYMCYKKYK